MRRTGPVIICAAALAFLTACSKSDKEQLNYEQPIEALEGSLNYGDEAGYLSCFLPQKKLEFESSEGYQPGFISDVFNKADYSGRLKLKIVKDSPLEEKDVDELEKQLKEESGHKLDFSKARKVTLQFLAPNGKDLKSTEREFYLVRYENNWYFYGDVMTSPAVDRL